MSHNQGTDLRDLALKMGAINHDARALAGLLRLAASGDPRKVCVTLEEAANVADLIAGTSDAGLQVLPDLTP